MAGNENDKHQVHTIQNKYQLIPAVWEAHGSLRRLEASHFLIYLLMEKIDISWKSIDFLCCYLWVTKDFKFIFAAYQDCFKRKISQRSAWITFWVPQHVQTFILFRLVLLNEKPAIGSCAITFKSVSAQLRCITYLDRNTKLKCKNISLAAIKKWHLTLLLGIRTGGKITNFPWYASTGTIQAFCSPRFFPFMPPAPSTIPQGSPEVLRILGSIGKAHRHGSWREQAWSATSLAKGICSCHQEEQWAWAQVWNCESSELTGEEWPVENRQNDKEGKSSGRGLSAGMPEGINTPLVHLALKKLVSK